MNILFVVSRIPDWPLDIPGVQVISAQTYLTDPLYMRSEDFTLFNLCTSYQYQGLGYYVSLLAEARGHHPVPDIKAIEDIESVDIQGSIAGRLDDLQGHRRRRRKPVAKSPRLAILMTPDQRPHPSGKIAIRNFIAAAQHLGMDAELITQADAQRISDFDGLFIRDTTSVSHYTYQISRQAAVAGMVVIDDPDSILRCTNKVFLAELFRQNDIPIPKTILIHHGNIADIVPALGLPCVLKRPDGAFSSGVMKIHSEEELSERLQTLFVESAIVVGQEYLPTAYDWRVGVLDRRIIFVCKYYMAKGHWQIIKYQDNAIPCEGAAEAIPIEDAPAFVLEPALRAANLIGDGFYGVDLKQIGNQAYVIEINDNPNVDAGNEDGILKDALYREIMGVFRRRIEAGKAAENVRQ
jgi:glutathione synthase/RimK-type ligase-like ATP-grasp enzyme